MGQRIGCPFPEYDDTDREGNPVYYVELPEKWVADHATRRDRVVEQTAGKGVGDTLRTFMIALALVDSWHLPGLTMEQVREGQIDPEFDLELVTWVRKAVLTRYRSVTTCPKGSSLPFSVLQRIAAAEAQRAAQTTDGASSEEE